MPADYLGRSVLCRAREQGREIAGFCHRHILKVPGIPTFSLDLADRSATRKLLASLRPTGILHCAAATDVDWCEDHPTEAETVNAKASGDLAELAAELGARFVYVSTDAVFDGNAGKYSEADQPSPVNAYARSKLHGERQVSDRNPRAAIARVNIYGWNAQDKVSLAEWVLKRLSAGSPVPGFTDVHFTPMLATDLAEFLLAMLDDDLTGIHHVGGSERISKYDFARLVAEAFGFETDRVVPARLSDAGLRAPRPRDTSLNSAKISAALGLALPDAKSGICRFRVQRENGYAQSLKDYLTGDGQ